MKREKLKTNLEKRLVEIKQKMLDIEETMQKQGGASESLKNAHQRLKTVYADVLLQYDQIEAMETEDEVGLPELEKSIYNSIESFDSAYTKAGAILEERGFSSRERSVDFKNPTGTK